MIKSIKVHVRSTTGRTYDAITVTVGDLHFSRDVTCARDIKQAKRIAEDANAVYWCDPAVWERYPGGPELAGGNCRNCFGPADVICGGQCKFEV